MLRIGALVAVQLAVSLAAGLAGGTCVLKAAVQPIFDLDRATLRCFWVWTFLYSVGSGVATYGLAAWYLTAAGSWFWDIRRLALLTLAAIPCHFSLAVAGGMFIHKELLNHYVCAPGREARRRYLMPWYVAGSALLFCAVVHSMR